MKKWHYLFLAFLAIGTVIILSESKQGKPEYRTAQGLVFGTRYNITYLYNADLQPDIDYTLALVDSALSMFNPQSTISAVNSSESIQVTDTMFLKVFRRAMEISRMTNGAFDVTVAPAVNAWGFGFKHSENISQSTIDSLLEITGYWKIHEHDGLITKDDPRIMLDCSAIAKGELKIDVAFLGAPSSDELGNACGYSRSENAKSICGSLGYALPDARYARHVVVITDDLVAYPNMPMSISAADVESVVVVDSVGDSSKIAAGAIRDSKNPRDILLAKQAAKVIINSGYFKDGFSIQTGTGGASLAAVKYIREEMLSRGIKASFALGGITAHMVKLHEEGLIGKLIDVQSFDKVAAESIKNDPSHQEVSAVEYASGEHLGSATHALDIVILSALEVDTQFNVNVLVGSDGIIRGAIGGHQDTAADSALSIIVCPLLRGRIPCVVPKVTTLITPGKSVDVVVTEYGIAVNPARPEIAQMLKDAGLKIVDIKDLAAKASSIIGTPDPLPFGDKVVGVVMNRDGSVLDKIYNIVE